MCEPASSVGAATTSTPRPGRGLGTGALIMLHRWDPFAELSRIQDDMTRAMNARGERAQRTFSPSVDIFEEKEAIVVSVELPGVKAEDVNITVENDLLT